jgi:hypothetical protein
VHGLPELAGFSRTFAMAALFLGSCVVAGLLIPAPASSAPTAGPGPTATLDPGLTSDCS